MQTFETTEELEKALGSALRALRLDHDVDQATVAKRAGIHPNTLRSLEAGRGGTLRVFVAVLRALGRESWIKSLAPVATINPLTLPRTLTPRQRVSRRSA